MERHISVQKEFDDLLESLVDTYGEELLNLEGIGEQTDTVKFREKFFNANVATTADVSEDATSNVDAVSIVAYNNESPKPAARMDSLYMLWESLRNDKGLKRANSAITNELLGCYYINDLSDIQKPYCYNFSALDLATKGLPFVGKCPSGIPKHLSSFCGQMVHFTSYASNQVMGAVGLADLLIVMSYYVEKEFEEHNSNNKELTAYIWEQVKQELQSLIYSMNQPFRGGLQSGFYNVSIYDDSFLESMLPDYVFPDGSLPNKKIVLKLQDMYLDMMNATMRISPITFPVTTANFCVDEEKDILDEDFLQYISEKNKEWAFVNIYAGESSTLSSCCRLRSKANNEYLGYTNSFGSGKTQIGSFGVVTINLAHLALLAKGNKDMFLANIRDMAEYTLEINDAKRKIIAKNIEMGMLPLYTHGFMSLQKQYATIGVNGIYESLLFMGENILEEGGQKLCLEILELLNNINEEADKTYKYAHNLEQTPSENSAIKLATKDKYLGLQKDFDLYSNQFIPLVVNADLLDRIKLQGMFDSEFSGGSIMHVDCGTPIEETESIADMIRTTVKMGCIYHAINYNLQKCEDGHMSVGKHENCPICGKPITDNYIRVVGFIINTKNAHKVRREEDFPKRQFYDHNDIGSIPAPKMKGVL